MASVTIVGVDAAFANMGFAQADIDVHTFEIRPTKLHLVSTEPETKKKNVRMSSDNLRRAELLKDGMQLMQNGASMMAAEVPSGAKSAKAAYGFGVAVGVLACRTLPIIQVNPIEVKVASVGKKSASKKEMIDWAIDLYPDLNWIRHNGKITNANEHLADALAIIHASVKTAEFKSAVAMMRSIAAE